LSFFNNPGRYEKRGAGKQLIRFLFHIRHPETVGMKAGSGGMPGENPPKIALERFHVL
jgi:hypothetical protein